MWVLILILLMIWIEISCLTCWTFKFCKIICCSICGSRLLIYGNTLLWRGVSLEKYFISTPSLPAALPCLQQLNNEAKYLSMSAGPSYDLREGDYAYKHQFSLEKNRFPPLKKCNPLIKQHKFPSKGITCSLWKLSLYLLPWLANLWIYWLVVKTLLLWKVF